MTEGGENSTLGERLRTLRKSRRVTGAELACGMGVTQGTVSKMETGRLKPDVDYLSRFAHTLRLTPGQASELLSLAGLVPQGSTPESFLRFVPCDFVTDNWAERRQDTAASAETRAKRVRVFQPLLVPGLLQTADYARHVLLGAGVRGIVSLRRAVAARVRRQRVLRAADRSVAFLITEAALRCRLAPPDVMLAQYQYLAELCASSRLVLGVLPIDSPVGMPLPPAFHLFDERVYIELPHGDLWLFDRSGAVEIYASLYRRLGDHALTGADAQRLLLHLAARCRPQ